MSLEKELQALAASAAALNAALANYIDVLTKSTSAEGNVATTATAQATSTETGTSAPVAAAPPVPESTTLVMSPTAPYTYEALKASNWTDEQIVNAGYATWPAPQQTAPAPQQTAPAPQQTAPAPTYTAEGLADILRKKAQDMGDQGVAISHALTNAFGTYKASEIPAEKYPDVVALVNSL
jgi:hypothetical protein